MVAGSSNAPATSGMKFALEDAGWTVHRVVPYETNRWIREAWIARVKTILQPTAGAR